MLIANATSIDTARVSLVVAFRDPLGADLDILHPQCFRDLRYPEFEAVPRLYHAALSDQDAAGPANAPLFLLGPVVPRTRGCGAVAVPPLSDLDAVNRAGCSIRC